MSQIIQNPITISRSLRKKQTPWEYKLWQHLRANRFHGIQFKRQVPINDYIVDFYCASKKLIIELDGGYHTKAEFKELDKEKEKYFEAHGYRVMRFWNRELEINFSGVLERIRLEVLFKNPSARLENPSALRASPLERRE